MTIDPRLDWLEDPITRRQALRGGAVLAGSAVIAACGGGGGGSSSKQSGAPVSGYQIPEMNESGRISTLATTGAASALGMINTAAIAVKWWLQIASVSNSGP